jgi:CheY-like chemotaxis protein
VTVNVPFCWQYGSCRRSCRAKDVKMVRCWDLFSDESAAGLKLCHQCAYQQALSGFLETGDPSCFAGRAPRGVRREAKTVLAVDDDLFILYALEEAVSSLGHRCISAMDGHAALTLATAIRPDLVISDVVMPRLSGYDLCHLLKANSATERIPVILVTALTKPKERLLGDLAGADAIIEKPFKARHLENLIVSQLAR